MQEQRQWHLTYSEARSRNGIRKHATGTVNTNANSTTVAVSFTPNTLGPTPTSYIVTGLRSTGGTISTTGTMNLAGNGNITFPVGGTHDVRVQGVNYNGAGIPATIATAVSVPFTYTQLLVANASTTYTIPEGATKMAAYVIGAGGGGSGGGGFSGPNSSKGGGGGGGGSAGIAGFKDFSVTPGQVVTITVGTGGTGAGTGTSTNSGANGIPGTVGNAGSLSKITYGGVDLATANGGGAGGQGFQDPASGGNGGAAGNASSNVAGAITMTGKTGGTGANANTTGNAGVAQGATNNITGEANIIAISPSNTAYGSGGGGAIIATQQGGVGTVGGGGNGWTSDNIAANSGASGAGGGGGAGSNSGNTPAGSYLGGSGGAGQVILYVY